MMEVRFEKAGINQLPDILRLYKKAVKTPQGIIRQEYEVNEEYITDFTTKSINNGLILVALVNQSIIGEIHAYTPDIFAFRHILTDLTIVINPEYQGNGIGRKLFETFLSTIMEEYKNILRVELYVRELNLKNVRFYESLGFINEGRQEFKILNSDNKFETPIHMVWFNPNYK